MLILAFHGACVVIMQVRFLDESRSTKGGELQTQEPGLHAKTIFVPWRLLCLFCGSTSVVGQN